MDDQTFLLDSVESQSDAFNYAVALQKRAAEVGFDWSDIDGVISKISEELTELKHEIDTEQSQAKIQAELGDLLFACCNLARHLNIDPTAAINSTNQKFYRRFNYVETCVTAANKQFSDFSLQELDNYWEQAKQLERLTD